MASLGVIIGLAFLVAAVVVFIIIVIIYAIYSRRRATGKELAGDVKKNGWQHTGPEGTKTGSVAGTVTPRSTDHAIDVLEKVLKEEDLKNEAAASSASNDVHTIDSGFHNSSFERDVADDVHETPSGEVGSGTTDAQVNVAPEIDERTPEAEERTPEIIIIPRSEGSSSRNETARADSTQTSPATETPQPPQPKLLTSSQPSVTSSAATETPAAATETPAAAEADTRTLERREVDDLKRSNSILARVSYFETTSSSGSLARPSASASGSLVRPAKRSHNELDSLQRHRVAAVLENFERSDTVLLGRQAPDAGDAHLLQQLTNDDKQQRAPGSASGTDVTDVPDDPVYAVPDRSRKSQKSQKSRPTSEASDKSNDVIPEVPEKSNN